MNERTRRWRRTPHERPHIPQRSEELTADWFTEMLDAGARATEVRRAEVRGATSS